MERVELLLLLMLLLSFYSLRVESWDNLLVAELQGSCSFEEREALLNFKRSMFNSQHLLSNWDKSGDCCAWKGVGCSSITSHVIKLDLSSWSFIEDNYFNATSLASSLFRLQYLQYLRLIDIYFLHTSVPKSIFSLTNLRYLDLSYSRCNGVISPHFGNLTNLRYLILTGTRFIGVILSHLGNMKNLRHLNFADLGLTGVILNHLENLTNLQHLDLSWNSLAASNLLWMSRLSSLQYVDLGNMNLVLATNWLHEIKILPTLSTLILWGCNLQTLPTLLPYSNFSSTINIYDLSYNQFSNFTVPSWLLNMTNLVELYVRGCQLHGKVPNNLFGALGRLKKLDLSNNFLDGMESSLIFGQTLGRTAKYELQYLDLSYNYLSGTLPNWIWLFRSLNTLQLQSNYLTGPISWASLSLLCDIDILDLSDNNFTEFIDVESASKCKEYKMTWMDISRNQLSGSIPVMIGQMRHLKFLHLQNNRLSGSIPHSLGQLMNLSNLNLGTNLLQGRLTDANFANLSQLENLDLSNNHLSFNMISFYWVPPFQISRLYLSSCYIGPHFPIWLRTQKQLLLLDLSNGGISDIIPSWFWNISSQIYYLNMSHNAIRGELPLWLNIKLDTIDMGSNLLEGHLPQFASSLYSATFSKNKFSNGIEFYLNANMSYLQILDLSENQLSDEIPSSICQMNFMGLLDLSYNKLWGEIPKCQWNISRIKMLCFISLANNNFWGSIPQWIGSLPMILSLYLSNNNFQGDLSFLRNHSTLLILDLGQNNISGNIPLWIGDILPSLKVLCLRSNRFDGLIPSSIFKLKGLQILDLANNFLSGKLPKSFKFLQSMTIPNKSIESLVSKGNYFINQTMPDSLMISIKGATRKFTNILSLVIIMDLSCNNLTGEVPIELTRLFGLRSLNLSMNQFAGHIPTNIGIMKSLESLDLSRNQFSGEIPESIVNLSGLSYLNLSYNQLSGRIPLGTQLETFNESSYYGNLELCGKPLLKTCEGETHNINNGGSNSHVVDDDNFGLFLGMGLGFVVGLWSVLGTLLLKRSWTIAYFQLYENMTNNIYVFIVVKINRWFNR